MLKIFKENKIDMINGSLVDKLIIYAIPLALTASLQQLFNAADIIVCGRFVGSMALAAVGANAQIINLFVNSFLGLSIGANVLIANYIGAEKHEKINRSVQTSMTFATIFGVILFVLGMFFSKKLLIFLGTPDDILYEANKYLRIIFCGIPFLVIYNFGAALLRTIGDTKRPLIILTFSGIINVVLNIILVVKFNLGVSGVAIATAFSNVIASAIVIYILVNEKSVIRYDITKWYINFDAFRKIMIIGIPSAIQGMTFSLSNLAVQTAINSLGAATIAANAAAVNFEIFPLYMFQAFGNACVTFMSQNLGAENFERCKKIHRNCILLGMLFSGLITLIFQVFSNQIISIFTTDREVIEIAMIRIRVVGIFAWLQTYYDSSGAGLRAMRHPFVPAIIVVFGAVIFRIFWRYTVFPLYNNYMSIAVVYPLSWLIITIFMAICYNYVAKKSLKTA